MLYPPVHRCEECKGPLSERTRSEVVFFSLVSQEYGVGPGSHPAYMTGLYCRRKSYCAFIVSKSRMLKLHLVSMSHPVLFELLGEG